MYILKNKSRPFLSFQLIIINTRLLKPLLGPKSALIFSLPYESELHFIALEFRNIWIT